MEHGNLPQWPGASGVYSYLYRVAERMGREAYAAHAARKRVRALGRVVRSCKAP